MCFVRLILFKIESHIVSRFFDNNNNYIKKFNQKRLTNKTETTWCPKKKYSLS